MPCEKNGLEGLTTRFACGKIVIEVYKISIFLKGIVVNNQLNTLIEDQNSIVTNFGQHERVVVFSVENNECYCRIDYRYGLRKPTLKDIVRVMDKGLEQIKGNWKITKRIMWDNGKSEDIYLGRR